MDENDVDMQSQNSHKISSSDETEEENVSDDNTEHWQNDTLKNQYNFSLSENEWKGRIFSNKHLGAYLKLKR